MIGKFIVHRPSAAEDWKLSYLARGCEDPQRMASVRRSFNAALPHPVQRDFLIASVS